MIAIDLEYISKLLIVATLSNITAKLDDNVDSVVCSYVGVIF